MSTVVSFFLANYADCVISVCSTLNLCLLKYLAIKQAGRVVLTSSENRFQTLYLSRRSAHP